MLLGERLDVQEGDLLRVTGVLRVIRHRASVANGVAVPGWVEVRVQETVSTDL